jgi:hypothetical protein
MMHPAVRRVLPCLLLVFTLSAPARAAESTVAADIRSATVAGGTVAGDFNGDGFADLAVGIPGDDGAQSNAGAVVVIRGHSNGLGSFRSQFWSEGTRGVPGGAKRGEAFGSAVAVGDFNGDGFADLATGAPGGLVDGIERAGEVVVLYGSRIGLRQLRSQRWTQNRAGVQGDAARDNRFGSAVAAGDFNGDGFADLAVSAPQQLVRGRFSAGSVTVLYGSAVGLRATGNQAFTQETRGIAGRAGDLHLFGWSLAAANLGRSGADDLAVGTPLDSVGGVGQSGSVTVLYGSTDNRLRPSTSQRWTQDKFRIVDRTEAGDLFGWSLAAANLGRSDFADLASGVPGEDLPLAADAGAVNVIFGGSGGLSAAGNQFRTQNSNGIDGQVAADDAFGSALAAGDFGLTSFADLAIGVPGEDLQNHFGSGAVNVIYGSRDGLVPRGNRLWSRAGTGMVGSAQAREAFGGALTAGQFGHTSRSDLAVGIFRHDIGSIRDAGAVAVLYGSLSGLRAAGNQLWTRSSPGISGRPHRADHLGRSVA